MPSITTILSSYTIVASLSMLVRTILHEARSIMDQFKPIMDHFIPLLPEQLRQRILLSFGVLYAKPSSNKLTIVINEYNGYELNQMYEAAEIYLRTKITNPSLERVQASKNQREKNLTITVEKGQVIHEVFEDVPVEWELISMKQESGGDKLIELRFEKLYKEVIVESYLPCILEKAKAMSEEDRVLKLHSLGYFGENDGDWGSVNLDHPATFEKLAMDPELKKKVTDDLDRFVKRREFYRRVGKPWKRGYLLYGPPGTGKSSLIAAMANYLNFHIYDVELASLYNTSELRRLLISTKKKSIIVIEDIDSSVQFHDREKTGGAEDGKVTLSGMLNFIDGLWSCCGDERIIIFTTNHKDKLDPALLRPGRMDMHIHMSYCTASGFRLLASNYLEIQKHPLFEEIDALLVEINATPAEIAEQLMRSDDPKTSLEGLIEFLKEKKTILDSLNSEVKDNDVQSQGSENVDTEKEENIESKSINIVN